MSQSGTAYSRSHLARFARVRFALRAHKNFRKKSVYQSIQVIRWFTCILFSFVNLKGISVHGKTVISLCNQSHIHIAGWRLSIKRNYVHFIIVLRRCNLQLSVYLKPIFRMTVKYFCIIYHNLDLWCYSMSMITLKCKPMSNFQRNNYDNYDAVLI